MMPVLALSAEATSPVWHLRSLAGTLSESRSGIDRDFCAMGEQLTGCVRLLMEISMAQRGIPQELNGPEFLTATAALREIREKGQELADARLGDGDSLQLLNTAVTALTEPLHTLRRAISTIQLIAVNAKIVAVGIRRKEPGFGDFATDMLELGREAASEIDAFVRLYNHLQTCLKAAMQAGTVFRQQHSETMAKIMDRVDEHLTVIAHHRSSTEGKARSHEEASQRMTARISDAVAAIQIGDATRQRIEHVELALGMLAEEIAIQDDAAFSKDTGTASMLARLGGAQLDAAAGDFEREIKELAGALRQLGGDAAAMLRDNARDVESLFSAGGTALGAVIDDMREIGTLLQDFHEMHAEVAAVAREFAHSVATMVSHLDTVRNIEQEIHLLSINTAVQCNRLGDDGRGLRVIAQDLRGLAAETAKAVRHIMTGLTDAQAQTSALTENEVIAAGDRATELGELAGTVVARLETVVEHLREQVETVVKAGPQAAQLLADAASSAERNRNASEEWRRIEKTLASSFADPAPNEIMERNVFDRIRAYYTMNSERELHDRLTGLVPLDKPETPEPALQAGDESILF